MSEWSGPINEAMDNIEAACIALGRCIRDGLRATRQDYTLSAPESPSGASVVVSAATEVSEGTGEAQEGAP